MDGRCRQKGHGIVKLRTEFQSHGFRNLTEQPRECALLSASCLWNRTAIELRFCGASRKSCGAGLAASHLLLRGTFSCPLQRASFKLMTHEGDWHNLELALRRSLGNQGTLAREQQCFPLPWEGSRKVPFHRRDTVAIRAR